MWHMTEQLKCRCLRSKVEGEVLCLAPRVRGEDVQGEGGRQLYSKSGGTYDAHEITNFLFHFKDSDSFFCWLSALRPEEFSESPGLLSSPLSSSPLSSPLSSSPLKCSLSG